jgi:hypothetical protein
LGKASTKLPGLLRQLFQELAIFATINADTLVDIGIYDEI